MTTLRRDATTRRYDVHLLYHVWLRRLVCYGGKDVSNYIVFTIVVLYQPSVYITSVLCCFHFGLYRSRYWQAASYSSLSLSLLLHYKKTSILDNKNCHCRFKNTLLEEPYVRHAQSQAIVYVMIPTKISLMMKVLWLRRCEFSSSANDSFKGVDYSRKHCDKLISINMYATVH